MTVVDLHPEDLIEKDANGELDAVERLRLETHLLRCAPCRFERQVRADFVEELSTDPAMKVHGLDTDRVTDPHERHDSSVVLRGSADVERGPGRHPSSRPRRQRRKAVWLLAAAALLVGGAAAAAMGLGEAPWPRLARTASVPVSVPSDEHPAQPQRIKLPRLPAPVADVTSAAASETPEPVATPTSQPLAPATSPRRPPPVIEPVPVIGPAELLDSESSARQRGEYGRALDIHRDLESRYPTSREAHVSRAIIGRLLLDRGDPGGALANYDSYLATGPGELEEETMVGRATALDRLDRSEEAAQAWSALLAAFPETPYASHARARSESSNGR